MNNIKYVRLGQVDKALARKIYDSVIVPNFAEEEVETFEDYCHLWFGDKPDNNSQAVNILATDDENVLGIANMLVCDKSCMGDFDIIATDKNHRKHGIGRSLWNKAENELQKIATEKKWKESPVIIGIVEKQDSTMTADLGYSTKERIKFHNDNGFYATNAPAHQPAIGDSDLEIEDFDIYMKIQGEEKTVSRERFERILRDHIDYCYEYDGQATQTDAYKKSMAECPQVIEYRHLQKLKSSNIGNTGVKNDDNLIEKNETI